MKTINEIFDEYKDTMNAVAFIANYATNIEKFEHISTEDRAESPEIIKEEPNQSSEDM